MLEFSSGVRIYGTRIVEKVEIGGDFPIFGKFWSVSKDACYIASNFSSLLCIMCLYRTDYHAEYHRNQVDCSSTTSSHCME